MDGPGVGKSCCRSTLKAYSRRTRNGKHTACRILFSFSVCSTCFSFTTFETPVRKKGGLRCQVELSHSFPRNTGCNPALPNSLLSSKASSYRQKDYTTLHKHICKRWLHELNTQSTQLLIFNSVGGGGGAGALQF